MKKIFSFVPNTLYMKNHLLEQFVFSKGSTLHNNMYTLNWAFWNAGYQVQLKQSKINGLPSGSKPKLLKKPLLIVEFGLSSNTSGFTVTKRDNYFGKI